MHKSILLIGLALLTQTRPGALPDPRLDAAERISRAALEAKLPELGIGSLKDLELGHREMDPWSVAHLRFRQTYRGIRVWGGEIIVHVKDDKILSYTDSLMRRLNVSISPSITSKHAVELAIAAYGCDKCLTSQPSAELVIVSADSSRRSDPALAYEVHLHRMDGSKDSALPVYFIDATSGKVLWKYNMLVH